MRKIRLGILGFGVVGSELTRIIVQNRERLAREYFSDVEIKSILIKDSNKEREYIPDNIALTTDPLQIISDPQIDIVCECIGGSGTELTKEYVLKAMENSKSVVMSSKKVLALYGPEITEKIIENNVHFRFDATVAGGIPVAKIIKECFKGEKIQRITGILNATSNFIYTRMEKDGLSFDNALKNAQELGYAENDPTEDINSQDALYKAIVLIMFSMKKWLDIKGLQTTPFSGISILDMNYAKELGYAIKPMIVFDNKDNLYYRVGPCMIKENHITANTADNFNIVVFEGSNTGMLGFYGQGAGSKPTASAMFDDIVSIINTCPEDAININRLLYSGIVPEKSVFELKNNLYWRITVDNTIGRFATIAAAFADNHINIEKIIQKDERNNKIGIVLLTSSMDEITMSSITNFFSTNGVEINTIIPFVEDSF